MKIYSTIPRKFLIGGNISLVNQLFGENVNRLFYDGRGHLGLDERTIGKYKYIKHKQKFENGKTTGYWKREERTKNEKKGMIDLLAPFDGYLTTNFLKTNADYGWGMFLTVTEHKTQYRILIWHITSPWRSLKTFFRPMSFFKPQFVRRGSIIAIGGNTGYSTGPHLHRELETRTLIKGRWTKWKEIDPMPHMADDIIYQKGIKGKRRWWYNGYEIDEEKKDLILKDYPKLYVN